MRWPVWRATVADHSMEPILRPADQLLAWRGVGGHPPRIRPGQLVIARHPGNSAMLLVKRAARLLPAGWWLESENPGAGAVDSRSFGAVPVELIEARVLLRYRRGPGAND